MHKGTLTCFKSKFKITGHDNTKSCLASLYTAATIENKLLKSSFQAIHYDKSVDRHLFEPKRWRLCYFPTNVF